jgi:hypothetical protein
MSKGGINIHSCRSNVQVLTSLYLLDGKPECMLGMGATKQEWDTNKFGKKRYWITGAFHSECVLLVSLMRAGYY